MKGKLIKKLAAAALSLALLGTALPQGFSGDLGFKASADEPGTSTDIGSGTGSEIAPSTTYNLNVNRVTGGYGRTRSADGSTDLLSAKAGDTVIVIFIANEGYRYVGVSALCTSEGWYFDTTEIAPVLYDDEWRDAVQFTMPEGNVEITPVFEEIPVEIPVTETYDIVTAAAEHGTVGILDEHSSAPVEKPTAAAGDTVRVIATPDYGYELTELYYEVQEDDTVGYATICNIDFASGNSSALRPLNTYEFTMPAYDVTVRATFSKVKVIEDGDAVVPGQGYIYKPSADGVFKFSVSNEEYSPVVFQETPESVEPVSQISVPLDETSSTAELKKDVEYFVTVSPSSPEPATAEDLRISIKKLTPHNITFDHSGGCTITARTMALNNISPTDVTEACAGQKLLIKLTQPKSTDLTLKTTPDVNPVEYEDEAFAASYPDYITAPDGMKNSFFMVTMPDSELALSAGEFVNTLSGWSISLDGAIGLNYYCKLDSYIDRVVLTGPNGNVVYDRKALDYARVIGYGEKYEGQYKLTYRVYTNQMGKKIGIHAYDEENGTEHEVPLFNSLGYQLDENFGLSVYDYPTPTGTLTDEEQALELLVHAMIDLGIAAENKFDNAGKDLGNISVFLDDIAPYRLTASSGIGSEYEMSLLLNDVTSIRIYVPDDVEGCVFDDTIYGGTNGKEFKFTKGGRRYVEVTDIAADELDDTFDYSDNNGDITVCALSYVGLVFGDTSPTDPELRTPLRDLAKALFKYHEYAENYFEKYGKDD